MADPRSEFPLRFPLCVLILLIAPILVAAWNNVPAAGKASTNQESECESTLYSTHDWIADRPLASPHILDSMAHGPSAFRIA